MSNFAFGTYRISDLNPEHIQALKEAIKAGISMIDTSSNYMDGGAERAIGVALKDLEPYTKHKIEIVSKFGYLQGINLQNYKEGLLKIKDEQEVVKYKENCYHCISKDFMHNQLSDSLKRLGIDKIDCYLIDSPEYYILDAINKEISKEERLDEMYRRVQKVFIGLEEEIKNNRIGSYGISSNSFSLLSSREEFFPYEDLITLAQNAADIVGNKIHGFNTIQLPINLLEQEGLKCADWAKHNGLRVLANRPFNAIYNGKMFRLCEYDESREYYYYLNELMEICDNEILKSLYNLLEQLDIRKHKFAWIGDYDLFLVSQILPHMKKTLEVLEEDEVQYILSYIDLYLKEYRKMVAFECSKTTKKELDKFFKECNARMQECALRFLMQNDSIDYILIGIRKPNYVYQILSLE